MSKFKKILSDLGLQKIEDSPKELKRLLNSYIEVMTHKLGRAPSPEEFFQEVQGVDEVQKSDADGSAQPEPVKSNVTNVVNSHKESRASMPSVLDTKVYFGLGEDKSPDPRAMLYYEHPSGGVYDIPEGRWLGKRPEVLGHLQSRPIYHDEHDIMSLILHGLMTPEEYGQLHSSGLISANAEKMWDMGQELHGKWNEIQEAKADIHKHKAVAQSHHEDYQELVHVIEAQQDRIHQMEVELQRLSPDHDYSDHEDLDFDPMSRGY